MRKIIKNKVYDTATATRLAEWENMQDPRSFNYVRETLYRKKNGEYFLHGEGGARSVYAERVEQNMWSSGEQIIPFDIKSARDWAAEKLSGEEFETVFGPVSEDEEDVLITFKAPAALDRKLADKAAELKTTKSDLLRKLIEQL